jgi:hypothetical protein
MKWHRETGDQVQVYRNLRNGLLSIKFKGLVVGHCDHIELECVHLKVNKEGAKRILNGGNKEVVAWAEGTWISCTNFVGFKGRKLPTVSDRSEVNGVDKFIRFNPKKGTSWVDADGYEVQYMYWMEILAGGTMWGVER